MKKIKSSDIYLNKKRAIINKKNAFFSRVKLLRKKRKSFKKNHQSMHRHNKILSLFDNKKVRFKFGSKHDSSFTEGFLDISLPETFSVIHDPNGFLKTLYNLNLSNLYKLNSVTIHHTNVIKIDLAAESIFDLLLMELRKIKKRIKITSNLPSNNIIKRYIKSIGIIKNLEIKQEYQNNDETLHRAFEMKSKRFNSSENWKENTIEKFVNHINDCLIDHGKKLTMVGKGQLAKYTGEILNNAEEHSGFDDVFITGYLDNANQTHWCEIAIFNFGDTIAKTFKKLPKDSYAYNEIKDYINIHLSNGLFGHSWTKENLLTIVALQGHISSKNKTKKQDRGQGTVDLIEFFQTIHKKCVGNHQNSKAEMAILSGSTHIYFDGMYTMQKNSSGRKIIAFNKENDLHTKPDAKYVKNLDLSFPGTVISIRFPMNHDNELLIGELNE